MIIQSIVAIIGVFHFAHCNSFGNVAVKQGAVIESDRPHFPVGRSSVQQDRAINFFGGEFDQERQVNFFRPEFNVEVRPDFPVQPHRFADFARHRHQGYGFGHHYRFDGHHGNRLGDFDYNRGCCRRRVHNCHRPLCDAPGFDYYDEVHHCCHRRTEGCFHRPLCAREYNFYDRNRQCCHRRARGCHRPLCHGGRHRHRHHSRSRSRSNSRSHDRSRNDRSRSNERHHDRSRSDERHHSGTFYRHHGRHHDDNGRHRDRSRSSSESHSRSHEKIHRRKGDRPKPIPHSYPAYLPYLTYGNGTKQTVNQHVNVNVHQNAKCGVGTSCYKKS